MIENNKITQLISNKTGLSFFKLRQVFYSTKLNTCEISLIYPSFYNLTDDIRENIKKIVTDYINLTTCKLIIKISKSFVEEDLIINEILKFLSKSYPVISSTITKNNISVYIENENKVRIRFSLEEDLYNYFIKFNVDKFLIEHLEKNFCATFEVSAVCFEKSKIEENLLVERVENLKRKSDLNALLLMSKDKYMVKDKKVVVGNEINFQPRYISSIKEPCDDCVIAGKLSFLTERSFTSKRKKKNKDGTEEPVVKPYFNFTIKDSSANITAVIFPSKAKYHKMNLLSDGNEILVRGRISKYNDKLEMFVKDISLCALPSKDEIVTNVVESEITDYQYVKPVKYNSFKQSNLFESVRNFSKEVLNNTFVVYDFETTGVNTSTDEIIEIGALKIVNGEFSEVFTTLVNPNRPIPEGATKVNRITNDMVANAYTINQVISDFYLFCKNCQMVGYNNIAFDSLFLINAGKRVGLNFSNTQIDAFLLAKNKLTGLKNYKLSTVSKYLEVNLIDAHRALNDVLATAECFLKLY